MVYGQIFTLSSDIIFLSDGITFTTDIRHLIFGQIFPDHHSARIRMVARLFWGEFHFEDIKFPVTIRDIHKIAKKNPITISVFDYENKEKISNLCVKKKHADLLLIEEKCKKHNVLIKDFNTFLYDYTLNCRRKYFCCYYLPHFSTEELLKSYTSD